MNIPQGPGLLSNGTGSTEVLGKETLPYINSDFRFAGGRG